MNKYLSEQELLKLKQKSDRSTTTIIHGSYWEYRGYVLEIPKLVDEILHLRKELDKLKPYKESHDIFIKAIKNV